MPELRVEETRGRIVMMSGLSLLMAALSAAVLIVSTAWPSRVIALLGVVFFGGGAVLLTVKMLVHGPRAVVLDATGLYPLNGGFVPWGEIRDVGVWTHRGNRMPGVLLHNPQSAALRAGRGLSGYDVLWSCATLPVTADEIVREMHRYLRWWHGMPPLPDHYTP